MLVLGKFFCCFCAPQSDLHRIARIFIPPNITAPNYAINLHLNKPWCLINFQTKSAHDAPYLTADYNMIVYLAQCNRDHSYDRFPFLNSIFQLVS